MQILSKSYVRAAIAALGALSLYFGLAAPSLPVPVARASDVNQLQNAISAGRGKISSLASSVGAQSSRLGHLQATISGLERRIARLQADIDAKRSELLKL